MAVWVGYDNADGRRRTLGGGATGGSVAVPIFEPIIQAVWAHHAPRTHAAGPSPETRKFRWSRTRVDADYDDGYARVYRRSAAAARTAGTLVEYCAATPEGSRSIPSTSWYRATITYDRARRDDRGSSRFECFFGGGRGGIRALGGPGRPSPPAFAAECAAAAAAAVRTAALAGGSELMDCVG